MNDIRKIRVMVVDDSALMRKMVSDVLNTDERIEVVATAANARFALRKIKEHDPDIITLDIDMPGMDGYTFLKIIMKENPVPVIILSGLTQEGAALTIKCLEAGAVEVIAKPLATFCRDITPVAKQLIRSIVGVYRSQVRLSFKPVTEKRAPKKIYKQRKKKSTSREAVFGIGISTGGPAVLAKIFPEFPAETPPILVVQHMPPNFTKSLAERLNSISQIKVEEAVDGRKIENNLALIAPGNYHMTVEKSGYEYKIALNQEEKIYGVRPAVDILFKSMADSYAGRVMAVIMTGMGRDGVEGLKAIKERGGVTFAQDESSCVVYGMPKVAVNEGCVDEIVKLENVVERLILGK
jgi:two-component system chemotaxis response regulator CheB